MDTLIKLFFLSRLCLKIIPFQRMEIKKLPDHDNLIKLSFYRSFFIKKNHLIEIKGPDKLIDLEYLGYLCNPIEEIKFFTTSTIFRLLY